MPSDWRVVHEAALVVGARHDGALVAQGALGVYDRAGTIAKMIVAPGFQRQRLGSRILDHLIDESRTRGIEVLGLVATALGRPLYEQRAFAPVGEVVVFTGTPRLAALLDQRLISTRGHEPMTRVEARTMGFARTAMLGARLRESIAAFTLDTPSTGSSGFVMATAQESQTLVGPLFAQSEADARALAMAAFRAAPGAVRIDVPGERHAFRAWLTGLGLVERLVSVEMARGATQLPWQVSQRFALAAQAWG